MLLASGAQLVSFYGFALVFIRKLRTDFLYNVATVLVSLHATANAFSFYVVSSLLSGNVGGRTEAVPPARWLACIAFPAWAATRGFRKGAVTAGGALGVLQIGFFLAVAHLGFFTAFSAYLILAETPARNPKSYFRLVTEASLALYTALFLILERGPGTSDLVGLDFRGEFLVTWLSVTVVGSFAVNLEEDVLGSIVRSALRGAFIGLAFWTGLVVSGGSVRSEFPQSRIAVVGSVGGVMGASLTPLMARIINEEDYSSRGLEIIANVLVGVCLPRLVIDLDASDVSLWNEYAKLSK